MRRREMDDLEKFKELEAEFEGIKREIIDALRPLPCWAKRILWFFYPFLREQE